MPAGVFFLPNIACNMFARSGAATRSGLCELTQSSTTAMGDWGQTSTSGRSGRPVSRHAHPSDEHSLQARFVISYHHREQAHGLACDKTGLAGFAGK